MRPLLLKVGVAVSLSVAGYLYSRLCCRSRPHRRRDHLPHAAPGVDEGGREPCGGGGGLKDEISLLQCEDDARSNYVTNGAATGIMAVGAAVADVHLSGDEEEERPLSEFNALVLQELEPVGLDAMAALEPAPPLKRSAPDCKNVDVVAEPEVVVLLKSLVRSLQERQRSRPENSSAAMEAPGDDFPIGLKIESLEAENRRLAADHRETKGELESARAKVRRLRRKLKSESRRAKERVAVLQRRAAAMQDVERRWGEAAEEAERRLARVKDLEGEVAELRRVNSELAMENSDMARKLESTQSLASSRLPSPEAIMAATEESNSQLRQKNEELTKQLEQLQTDHCANVEELVYLRWVNACLRYELRNHQPAPGKTTVLTRDLSRTPSPESEHRVKQLILEYANSGADEKSISTTDHFDSETCSASSQASYGDHPEDVVPVEVISGAFPMKSGGGGSSSGKKKFFTKLKRLMLGKESKGGGRKFDDSPAGGIPTVSGGSFSARRAISPSASSFDEMVSADRSSCDSPASCDAPPDDAEAGDHGRRDGGSPPTTRICLARV